MPCGRRHELCQPRTEADGKPSRRATSVFARLRVPAVRRGDLVCQATGSRRAELDVLRPVTPAANGPANALDLPVSARTHRDGPGCRSTGRSAARTGLHVRSKRRWPRVPGSGRRAGPRPGQVLL